MVRFQTMSKERQTGILKAGSYRTAKALPDRMEGERLVAVEPDDV
jgi:hypothetical protein